jgi:hypothetical protein
VSFGGPKGKEKFVLYDSAIRQVLSSTDGSHWTNITGPNHDGFAHVFAVKDHFYFTGDNQYYYSDDAITWNKLDLPAGSRITYLEEFDAYFALGECY